MMTPNSLKIATIPIHISAVIYALLGIGSLVLLFFPIPAEDDIELMIIRITLIVMFVVCAALVVFLEIVVQSLKAGRYWAWIAGICVAGLYIPSIFIPLGIPILLGLLKEDVKQYCARKETTAGSVPRVPPPIPHT